MILKEAIREELGDLEDLLKELEAGQATWNEYAPALLQLREYTGSINTALSNLVATTVSKLKEAGTAKRIDQAREVIQEARAQLDEIRETGGRRTGQKRSVRPKS